jgi:hypothetical protein
MDAPFPLLKKYIKLRIYGQQAKQLQQQLRCAHALIQPRATVKVSAITEANVLHNSDE